MTQRNPYDVGYQQGANQASEAAAVVVGTLMVILLVTLMFALLLGGKSQARHEKPCTDTATMICRTSPSPTADN